LLSVTKIAAVEEVPCPLGCRQNDEVVLSGCDLLHNMPGEFTIVKCHTCGLMRTNPRPTQESIGLYYPEDYGPYIGTRVKYSAPRTTDNLYKLTKSILKCFFDFNTNTLPKLPPGRMLEVGCASGTFLHQMANQGWHVQGIEISEKAAQAAALLGYHVHVGPLETAQEPSELFDLVVGWMVLEHLHDPVGGLKKLHDWSKPGAWLVLSVPNAGSLEFRMFKEKWYALQLPTHLYHYTPDTLRRVLSAGGWKLKKVSHHRVLTSLIASIGYVLRDKGFAGIGDKLINYPNWAGRWSSAVLYPLSWLLSVFGQTGRMTIWAKKETD